MLFARPGAGTTAEAIACGTPVLFDVSRGVMPQEQNNLSFWQKRTGGLASTKKANEVPRRLHSSSLPVIFPYARGETPLRFLEKLREIVASR
jgi:UDP-N-acetylglucosamine:LPS N-acetylglucosamine transferase